MDFIKLKLDDMHTISPFMKYSANRACDNTVGGRIMWRDYLKTEYAICDDALFFRVKSADGTSAYSVPLAKDVKKALLMLKDYCKKNHQPLIFSPVMKEDLPVLEELFEFESDISNPDADWFDYLYNASDLATLVGKKYNGQRNHINYFNRTFLDKSFKKIDESNIAEIIAYYTELTALYNKDTPVAIEERKKVFELLENYGKFNHLGGVLYADGKIVAFAIGETAGDTLFVHVEKSMLSVRGASQTIVKEFAAMYATGNIKYINREEDIGDEGLRTSKKSYHPCEMIEKYTVIVK